MAENIKNPVVLITNESYQRAKQIFDSVANIKFISAPANENELSQMIKEEDPVAVVIGTKKYTGPLYDALKKGRLIARFGVGCDGIDFEKARDKGLMVTNTQDVLEATVAEFTVFLAAEVLRKIGASHEQMKKGQWLPNMGKDLHGKTWAILGMGKIGKNLGKILSYGFGVRVFGFKQSPSGIEILKKKYGAEKVSLNYEEVVREADIVSILIPANKDTFQFLNRERLQLLKPGAILINTGRGSLVDENVLYDLLKSGHLAGAGLDVYENEPYSPIHPDKDLRKLPNVVLTPHIGSSTTECAERMAKRVIQNIRYHMDGNTEAMDIVQG